MYQVYLKNAPISAKYDCGIKAEYQKDLMGLVEEDMILAVKNFKTKLDGNNNTSLYTLLVASRIWPEHYGLRAISEHTYYPIQFEVIGQSVSDWGTYDKATMMIQISSIPVNYDLIVNGLGERLGGVNLGGFFDREVDDLLGLDGVTHPTIILLR